MNVVYKNAFRWAFWVQVGTALLVDLPAKVPRPRDESRSTPMTNKWVVHPATDHTRPCRKTTTGHHLKLPFAE